MSSRPDRFALIDSTLARGQQCVWQGRMTSHAVLPYLKRMDGFGFQAIDIMTPALFETCAMELGEDPFERIRLAAQRATATPLNVWTRGRYLFADTPLPEDLVIQGIELIGRAGARHLTCYDPLNDVSSLWGNRRRGGKGRYACHRCACLRPGSRWGHVLLCGPGTRPWRLQTLCRLSLRSGGCLGIPMSHAN